jgi:hypothetical protein
MAKGFTPKGGRSPVLADRQQQAAAAKESALAHLKRKLAERQEKRAREDEDRLSRPIRDLARYQTGLSRIPFLQLDRPGTLHPSEAYKKLISLALEAINTDSRRAILCWPTFAPSPAAVVAMLMLGDCESCDPITQGGYAALSAPWGLRALIFPYARTAHRALRHIYVDKNYLHGNQLKHQIRCIGSNEDPAFADFHKTLARVHTLTGKTRDGEVYPEFANPCLDELLPSGPCAGTSGRSELLGRISKKIDLKEITRTKAADDPNAAKFYLFGIWANDNAEEQLKALKTPPNLVILQLDAVGRRRLGKHWEIRIKDFLSALESRMGNIPVLALTDDPWTYDRLRFDTLFSKPRKRKEPPCPSDVIFATDSEIITDIIKPPAEYAPIKNCSVLAYAGEVEKLLRRLRSNRLAATQSGDGESAERLGRLVGVVRRCTSLPGSRAEFSQYIEDQCGALAAAELMVPYRVGATVKELRDSHGAWPQLARMELMSMCDAVQSVWDRTDLLTPMKPLLRELVSTRFLHNSSRTVLVFQNEMLADFGAHVLMNDQEIGPKVTDRIEKGMIRLLDRHGLEDLDGLPKPDRNHIKTLVVVSPSRAAMLELLTKPWLPENVVVLSDADTLESSARDTDRLSSYPELNPLKQRFDAFTAKAAEAVSRVHGVVVALDRQLEAQDDAETPYNLVVNLAGKVRENQTLYRIELAGGHGGGQVVIAKPGSKLVVQDRSQVLPIYKEVEARELAEHDRICVIGDAFVEMARPLVNITKRAAEEIRDYHLQVKKRFAEIPGDSVQARLRILIERMGVEGIAPQRAHYWVDLDDQLSATLDDVVPSAPRDFPLFQAFMKALGLTGAIVEKYWMWAVIAQRSHKLQAGMSIRDAYRGILVDSYSAQSDNPTRVQELRRLRAAAENFVGVIQKIETIKAENAGA